MKQNQLIVVLILLGLGFFLWQTGKISLPFKVVCTKYAWDECKEYGTEYEMCYETITKTEANCEKCGSVQSLVEKRYTSTTSSYQCEYDRCYYTSKYITESCPSTLSSYSFYKNKGETITHGGSVNMMTCILGVDVQTTCKTCTFTEQSTVGTPCNSRQVCVSWTANQGSQAPSGAINIRCVEQFESCGNNICESQFDETQTSCPADCVKTPPIVCNVGEAVCQGDKVYSCKDGQWSYSDTCQFGCEKGVCVQEKWDCGTWGGCKDNKQYQTCKNNLGATKTNERTCVGEKSWIEDNWMIVVAGAGILLLLGLVAFRKR